ncbi:MAG: hypothetical protein SVR04_02600, partial [Spirochaetota bacterium]|nr:hypothetical protein [Spirochaetota bacterium]
VETLQSDFGINLNDEVLRKLIRNEFHRRMDFPPVYDLKYDRALQKSVELLLDGTIAEMISEAQNRSPALNSGAGIEDVFSIFDVPSTSSPSQPQRAKP